MWFIIQGDGEPTDKMGDDAALIVVDLQRDFVSGLLAVPDASSIIEPIQTILLDFNIVVFSMDSHPPNHVSFTKYPVHCVEGTSGAELVIQPSAPNHFTVLKGRQRDSEETSAYQSAKPYIGNIHNIYIVGLALDICVKDTALEAVQHGHQVWVIEDLCRAIEDTDGALKILRHAGVQIVHSWSLFLGSKEKLKLSSSYDLPAFDNIAFKKHKASCRRHRSLDLGKPKQMEESKISKATSRKLHRPRTYPLNVSTIGIWYGFSLEMPSRPHLWE